MFREGKNKVLAKRGEVFEREKNKKFIIGFKPEFQNKYKSNKAFEHGLIIKIMRKTQPDFTFF